MSGSWSDWRTDTAERAPLPAVPPDERDLVLAPYAAGATSDETHSLPPLLVPAEPTGDLPRSARWPLYADEPPAAVPGGRGPAGLLTRPALPWLAAALAVALTAGTGVWFGSRPEPTATSSLVETPPSADAVPTGEAARGEAASRGDVRREDGPDGADRDHDRDERYPRARRDSVPVASAATATAPSTAPPNQDLAGRTVSYAAPNMLDGRAETAWRMVGNGRGTVLTLRFDEPVEVTSVGLVNGYAKTGSAGGSDVDWYAANRRVRQVEWYFDDGSRVVHSVQDTRRVQRTDIRPRTTSTLRLRLARVSAPGAGSQGRDYTAVSEVVVDGVPQPGRAD